MPVVLAVPAIEIALLALLAVLIYYGTPLLVKLIATVIPSDLPVIGDRIVRAVERAGNWAESVMRSAVHAQLSIAARVIRYPVASVKGLVNSFVTVTGSLAHMGAYIIRVVIPAASTALFARMNRLHAAAIAYIDQQGTALFNRINRFHAAALAYTSAVRAALAQRIEEALSQALAFTRSESAALFNRINRFHNAAIAYTVAVGAALELRIEQSLAKSLNYAKGAVTELTQTVDRLYHQAINHADAAAAHAASAAVTALEAETAGVLSAAWPGLADDLLGLEHVIGADLDQIGSAIRGIDLTGELDIAAGLAATTAMSVAAARFMRDCGIPNCKNLSALGRAIRDLDGLLAAEGMFEFIAEFVTNPEAAGRTVIDETQGLIGGFVNTFKDVLSL